VEGQRGVSIQLGCESATRRCQNRQDHEAELVERAERMNGLDGSWAADQVNVAALALLPQAVQEPGRISVDNDMVRRATR